MGRNFTSPIQLLFLVGFVFLLGCPLRQTRKVRTNMEPASLDAMNHPGWFDRTTRAILKKGVLRKSSLVKQCLQRFSTSIEHANCVYWPWIRGSQVQRISLLHRLVLERSRGHATMLVLLRKENLYFRRVFSNHILAYIAHTDILPIKNLARYYNDSREVFRTAFDDLGEKARIRAAQKLLVALDLQTRKQVKKEWQGYLKFSSKTLWKRIQEEKDLAGMLTLVSLVECGQGLPSFAKNYRDSVFALHQYYLVWKQWKRSVEASGVRNYQSILKTLQGELTISQLRGINGKEFRKAMRLTRALQSMKSDTEQSIAFVKNARQRARMLRWFRWLVQRSPIVSSSSPSP